MNAVSESEEEVRQHHAAVAASTKDGPLRSAMSDIGYRAGIAVTEMVPDCANRERQVGTGVAIRHRKHVDPVQLRTLQLSVITPCNQGAPKTRPIEIGNLGQAQRELLWKNEPDSVGRSTHGSESKGRPTRRHPKKVDRNVAGHTFLAVSLLPARKPCREI